MTDVGRVGVVADVVGVRPGAGGGARWGEVLAGFVVVRRVGGVAGVRVGLFVVGTCVDVVVGGRVVVGRRVGVVVVDVLDVVVGRAVVDVEVVVGTVLEACGSAVEVVVAGA